MSGELDVTALTAGVRTALRELAQQAQAYGGLGAGKLVVIGCSTSEVIGERIGSAGSEDVAAAIWRAVDEVRSEYGFDVAVQCCEHLNRALVLERTVLERNGWTEVSAVPVRKAGGSMAALAYRQMSEPCLAETISAHAALDIGETLVGMHLRRVAVPFRPSIRWIGEARLTAAYTRPPLIGGARAVYERQPESDGAGADMADIEDCR